MPPDFKEGSLGCPVCKQPPKPDFAPFCSRRCADIDLGRWLKGGYVIPGGREQGEEQPSIPLPEPDNDDN